MLLFRKSHRWIIALLAVMVLASCVAPSPVGRFGRLKVENKALVSASGQPIQLRGVSLHSLGGDDWLLNPAGLQELRDDWKVDVVRLAMYTNPAQSGYLANPGLEKTMDTLVQAAANTGLYAIVDWHILWDGDPTTHQAEAVDFFARVAARYKDLPNVLLEICNEPNGPGVTWDDKIRPYAETVLAAIRKVDPSRVVLVGTPNWSQDVDIAARHPLPDPQVMYTFHWYAGTHGDELRARVAQAAQTIPLFCSEWGTTDSSGSGDPFPDQTAVWLKFLDEHRFSSCNWSLTTVREGSAILKGKFEQQGPMKDYLTPSGTLVYRWLREARP